MLVSLVNETLRWRHKANLTHSHVLPSMGQESAQLIYFEKVQHSKENSRSKNVFAKAIRAVARVYLCAKKVWCWWHFKLIVTFKGNRLPNYIQTNEFASHWPRLSSKVNFPDLFMFYLSGDCGTCVFISVWNVYCQLEKWKRWGACDIHWFEF